jgi:hypothetical protein
VVVDVDFSKVRWVHPHVTFPELYWPPPGSEVFKEPLIIYPHIYLTIFPAGCKWFKMDKLKITCKKLKIGNKWQKVIITGNQSPWT